MPSRAIHAVLLSLAALAMSLPLSVLLTAIIWLPPLAGVAYEAALAIALGVLWVQRYGIPARERPLQRLAMAKVVGLTCLVCVATGSASHFVLPASDNAMTLAMDKSAWGTVAGLIAATLAGPLLEEALFRGFLLSRLRSSFTPTTVILITAAVFTFAHGGDLTRAAQQFVGGIALGAIVMTTGRLWLAVLTHSMMNVSGVVEYGIFSARIPEALGLMFPVLSVLIALIAALALRNVLRETQWQAVPNSYRGVAPPVTWTPHPLA